jgi:hypothetical protein
MSSSREHSIPNWLPWSVPLVGVLGMVLILLLAGSGAEAFSAVDSNLAPALMITSLLVSGGSGVAGLMLAFVSRISVRARAVTICLSAAAILVPAGIVVLVSYALAHWVK